MTLITLPNGKTYDADWAAVSVFTENFNAAIATDDIQTLVSDFSRSDPLVVDYDGIGRVTYEGYQRITRLRYDNGKYHITIEKEA